MATEKTNVRNRLEKLEVVGEQRRRENRERDERLQRLLDDDPDGRVRLLYIGLLAHTRGEAWIRDWLREQPSVTDPEAVLAAARERYREASEALAEREALEARWSPRAN